MSMSGETLIIRGAREHNLRNIDVRSAQPANRRHRAFGSGKSSLASTRFTPRGSAATWIALGVRAAVLGLMEKPDVDSIEGLSPAISIEQKTAGHNPRSTVGTVTEVYDYLRLLYARAGTPHCSNCGRPVERQTASQISDILLGWPDGVRIEVLSPLVRQRKGEFRDLFENARKQGFVRALVDRPFI